MPLPEPAPRRLLHNRTIICEGFERDDGLWDIDAHLTDVKTYGFESRHRGSVEPGEPIHGMWLRLTLDEDFLVHGVEAAMDYTPFGICNTIAPSHVKLIGERIGPGWNRRVRELLGGTQGCAHMREMLGPHGDGRHPDHVRPAQRQARGGRGSRPQTFCHRRLPRLGKRRPGRRDRISRLVHRLESGRLTCQPAWASSGVWVTSANA